MDVCLVSAPVTRNSIGCPANMTFLPMPGIRMTAFALMTFLLEISCDGPNMIAPPPRVAKRLRKSCKTSANDIRSEDGDGLRIRPVSARHGRQNTILRRRADRARAARRRAAPAASGTAWSAGFQDCAHRGGVAGSRDRGQQSDGSDRGSAPRL